MKTVIYYYSRTGQKLAQRAARFISGSVRLSGPLRLMVKGDPIPYEKAFSESDALLFIGSCGIAVRMIAPSVNNKLTDPAVLVMDEAAKHVISLLSGHVGGANEMAIMLSEKLGAEAVITTATDVHGLFSVDSWAAKMGYALSSMEVAKDFSASILEAPRPVLSEWPLPTLLPKGLFPGETGSLGIYLGIQKKNPFQRTLRVIPKVLHLGIGCRKGVSMELIERVIEDVFEAQQLDLKAVKALHSIDLKEGEKGLLAYGKKCGVPLFFYSAEELNKQVGTFTPSSFVREVTGTDNVCERAASMGSSKIILRKHTEQGVSLAISQEAMEVHFV